MPSLARRREQRPGEGDRRSPPPLDERPSGGDEHAQDAEVARLTPRVRGYSRSPPALSSPMCRPLMSTFPQLSTSKKMHGFMRSRESVAQNDWSGDALQEALLNPPIFTRQHESRAPYTRIGCGQTIA